MDNITKDGSTTSPMANQWNLFGSVVYASDRSGMSGGGIEASYCYRFADYFCADGGIGFFGTMGSLNDETSRVPNLHLGLTYHPNETLGIGFIGRAGWALLSGERTDALVFEEYSDRGLYLEGALRLSGDVAKDDVLGWKIQIDGGLASMPGSGGTSRSVGGVVRAGPVLTW